jgi:hypothetical protein
MKRYWTLLALLICGCSQNHNSDNVPFKQIDPICLSGLFFNSEVNKINTQEKIEEFYKEYKINDEGAHLNQNNLVLATFKNKDSNSTMYVGYEYLGIWNDYDILYVVENGGGSGVFTSIVLHKIGKDRVYEYKIIDGGDRAFGGILPHPIVDGENLYYLRYLSNYELWGLSGGVLDQLPTEEGSSANEFVSIGKFRYNLKTNTTELLSLNLLNPEPERLKSSKIAQVINQEISSGQTHLNKKQANRLLKKLKDSLKK